jgi:hypothetical protein
MPQEVGRLQEGNRRVQWEAPDTHWVVLMLNSQGLYKFHHYQVVGRHNPTENEPNPTVYRMKVWASDAVRAKSKFW